MIGPTAALSHPPMEDKKDRQPHTMQAAANVAQAVSSSIEAERRSVSTPPSRLSIVRSMPACFLVVALFTSGTWTEIDLSGSFFRSTITCDRPIPVGNPPVCPTGSIYRDRTCAPVPRGDDAWSGSAHCFDQGYVVRAGMIVAGRVGAVSTLGLVIANLFLGSIIIDGWGRKPMMVMGLFSSFVQTGSLALSCHAHTSLQRPLIYAGAFLASSFNAFDAAANAMGSDKTESDEVGRSLVMTLLNAMREFGVLVGFVAGFSVLQADVEDYFTIWLVIAGIFFGYTLLAIIILPETMPRQDIVVLHDDSRGVRRACIPCGKVRKIFADIGEAFRIIATDPYVFWNLLAMVLSALGVTGAVCTCGAWAISICKYNQAIASLMGIWQPFWLIIGSMISTSVIKVFGPYLAYSVGAVLIAVGTVLVGFGAFIPEMLWLVRSLWWGGYGVVMGLGMGLSGPCVTGIFSARVSDNAQGRLFSMVNLCAMLGAMLGNLTFTNYIFVNEGTPLRIAAGWFLAGGVQAVVLVIFGVTYLRYIRPTRNSGQRACSSPTLRSRLLTAAGSFIAGNVVEQELQMES